MTERNIEQLNTVRLGNFLANNLPDRCADLIIADPPYFGVKGDFDFVWPNFSAYLADVERWAVECARLLAPTGNLIWWGDSKRLSYSQTILDKFFRLLANCVWYKRDGIHIKQAPESLRTFRSSSERFLHYESRDAPVESFTSPNAVHFYEPFDPLRRWLYKEIAALGGSAVVGKALGISSRAVDHWKMRSQWQFPPVHRCAQLVELYPPEQKEQKRGEYAGKREAFEKLLRDFREEELTAHEQRRRPFRGELYNFRDVITASQETHLTKAYRFPTKKPPTLTRQLIETCSRPGGLVVIPFAGSGTECEAAKLCGRSFVAFDVDQRAVEMAQARADAVHFEPLLPL